MIDEEAKSAMSDIEPPTCLGRDMDCGRTLPCPDHGQPPASYEWGNGIWSAWYEWDHFE